MNLLRGRPCVQCRLGKICVQLLSLERSCNQNQVSHSVRATLRDRWEDLFQPVPGERRVIWNLSLSGNAFFIHIRENLGIPTDKSCKFCTCRASIICIYLHVFKNEQITIVHFESLNVVGRLTQMGLGSLVEGSAHVLPTVAFHSPPTHFLTRWKGEGYNFPFPAAEEVLVLN